MRTSHLLLPPLLAALFTAGAAMAADALKKVDGVMVDASGKTVYTFDKDAANSGKSACNGPCATLWPPVPAEAAPGAPPYSVVTRDDGSKQLAYKGKPLYHYSADQKAGERTGDGFKDVWHVVKE